MFHVVDSEVTDITGYAAYPVTTEEANNKPFCLALELEGERPFIVQRFASYTEARFIMRKRNG